MIDPDKPSPPKTKWSDDEDRILLVMFKQGQKRAAVAARFGCSEEDVAARFAVLCAEQQEKEEAAKRSPKLDQVDITTEMAQMLKDQPALEALFTVLCGKYNEQGVLLKQLSQLLSIPREEVKERLAECLFVSISVRLGSNMTQELRMEIARQFAEDILTNFHVYPIVKLQFKDGRP